METGSKDLVIKTNSILDEYEVQWNQKLGCGISGPVRPCKHKATGQRYALKCLHDKARSRREVALHFKCGDHPHIVAVYDCYANEVQFAGEPEPKSRLLLVMELMDGGELFDRISKQKYFLESQASTYTRQIGLAIKKCHSMNIAHRDIKPENLLLKDNSENAMLKLSDFGFAKEDDGSLMTPHFTPYYVAPQILEAQTKQARQAAHIILDNTPYTYDKSCDMWSLGVIVYIMLCGYPPFYSETPTKQITRNMKRKIMAGEYEFPHDDWAHISAAGRDLVQRLLTVDARARLSVDQVLAHPWLHQAPHTQLNSPAVMLDQNNLLEAQFAHSAQLTTMRLPDQQLRLKPLSQLNNSMLRKRRNSRVQSEDERGEPSRKSQALHAPLDSLRHVIAHCIMPPTGGREQQGGVLEGLVACAWQLHHHHPAVTRLFTSFGWTGSGFSEPVNKQGLAVALSELVQQISAQQHAAQAPSDPPPGTSRGSPANQSATPYPGTSLDNSNYGNQATAQYPGTAPGNSNYGNDPGTSDMPDLDTSNSAAALHSDPSQDSLAQDSAGAGSLGYAYAPGNTPSTHQPASTRSAVS